MNSAVVDSAAYSTMSAVCWMLVGSRVKFTVSVLLAAFVLFDAFVTGNRYHGSNCVIKPDSRVSHF